MSSSGDRPNPLRQLRANPWLIAVVVALAAFMEILDTSIANVALPYMAGDLGVSNDESTWVLTSYLVSNAIVLPISGWIAGVVGRKRLFMACIGFFTLSSLLCGIAPSLAFLLLFRILQGLGGGGLQPMAQAILADTFPPQQRGLAFALYGITAVVAPTIGPILGGWITYNYSWRWIFFINLPVGLLALFLVFRLIEDPPYLKATRQAGVRIDYIGVALLVLGRRRPADHARPGPAGRLVRVAVHSHAGDHRRRRPDFARRLGVVRGAADHRRTAVQELQLPRRQRDDVPRRRRAVQQPRHDAAVPADAPWIHRSNWPGSCCRSAPSCC